MAKATAADMTVHVGADTSDLESGMGRADSAVDNSAAKWGSAGLAMGAGAGVIGGGFLFSINKAAEFEAAMSNVNATLGASGPEFEQLSALALQIGQDTEFGATQGAQAIEELGRAGMSIDDILGGGAMGAANFASAVGIEIPRAATAMTQAMNIFGLEGKDATRVADVYTAALNSSALTMTDLEQGMANAGTTAAALGIPIEDTTAALGLFANNGLSGAEAGTGFKTMLTSLAAPTDEARQLMADLGIEAFNSSGEFMGMTHLAGELETSLAGMSDEQRMATLETLFGADAMRVANILYEEGAEGMANMTEEVQSNGQASEAARKRMDNFAGVMEELQGSIETAAIVLGSVFLPVLSAIAEGVMGAVNWFSALPEPMIQIVGVAAGLIGGLLAIGAAFAGVMAAGALIPGGFAGVAGAMMALLGPITLIIAAVGLLAAAWYLNIGGIRDKVMPIIDTIVSGLTKFVNYVKLVATSGQVMNDMFSSFPAAVQPAMQAIGRIVDAFADLYRAFSDAGLRGLLFALEGELRQLGSAFLQLGAAIIGAIAGIDWGAVGSALLSGLQSALSFLGGIAADIVRALGDLAGAIGSWLWEQASAVDWGGLISSAASAAGDITGTIVSKLGDLFSALFNWVWNAASSVPWGELISAAAGAVGNVASTIISKIGDLGSELKTWYDNAIDNVDWAGMGETVGTKVGDLSRTLGPKALQLVTGFAQGIVENWQLIGTVLGALVLGLPTLIGYLGMTLAPKALEFIQGFIDGLNINWPMIGAWLALLPQLLLAAVGSLAMTLLSKGVELLSGLLAGLNQHWPTISAWLMLVGTMALAALGSLAMTLLSKGVELLQGLLNGLNQHWPTISAWLMLVGTMALAAIGSLAMTLLTKGVELLQGILTGLNQHWPTISAWLMLVGTMALAAIGDLTMALLSKGVELLSGVLNGLNQHWPTISAWLLMVGEMALAAVGDLSATLISRGIELIVGLFQGVIDYWPTVTSWLGTVSSLIFNAVGSLARTLHSRGTEAISGMYDGVLDRWAALKGWLSGMPGYLVSAVGSLGRTLHGTGIAAMSGFYDGILDRWAAVKGWLAGLPGYVTGAIGDMSGALKQAGLDVMSGFLAGLEEGWGTVTGFLSGLNPANFKGPPERDRKMLIENGILTMEGYMQGLAEGWHQTTRMLTDMVPSVEAAAAAYPAGYQAVAGPAAGGQQINYYDNREFTVKVDDLPELQRAAEFLQDLQADRERVYGST